MANSVWRISAHKFGLTFVGKIVQRIFRQTLCASSSLDKQSLVKSTPNHAYLTRLHGKNSF